MADNGGPSLGTPFATSTPPGGNASTENATSITMTPEQLNSLMSSMMSNLQSTMQASVQASVQAALQVGLQSGSAQLRESSRSTRAAALESSRSTVPKLDSTNFSQWESTMSSVIRKAGLWEYIVPGVQAPSELDRAAYDRYILESSTIFSTLTGSLEENARFQYADGQESPRDLRNNLIKHFRNDEIPYLRSLTRQLASISLDEGGNALDHVSKIQQIRRRLAKTKFEVSDEYALSILLGSLPPSYDTWVTLQENLGDALTFNSACASLESHYRNHSRVEGVEGPLAFIASIKTPKYKSALVPEDLRFYLDPGKLMERKCPELNERAQNTCRDCLLTGHRTGSKGCDQYHIRLMLFGPRKTFGGNTKKSEG